MARWLLAVSCLLPSNSLIPPSWAYLKTHEYEMQRHTCCPREEAWKADTQQPISKSRYTTVHRDRIQQEPPRNNNEPKKDSIKDSIPPIRRCIDANKKTPKTCSNKVPHPCLFAILQHNGCVRWFPPHLHSSKCKNDKGWWWEEPTASSQPDPEGKAAESYYTTRTQKRRST